MRGEVLTKWKCDDKPHPHEVVGHAGEIQETVACEIHHFAYVLDLRKARIEWPHVQRKRYADSLAAAPIAGSLLLPSDFLRR